MSKWQNMESNAKIKKMKKLFLILFLTFFIMPAMAAKPKDHSYYEKDYQRVWCNAHGGTMEYLLPDKARVDCVTPGYAIEFDFAKKWAESIGQALYYGTELNKPSGVVLILEHGSSDTKYLKRLKAVAGKHGITVWTMTPADVTYKNKIVKR